MTDESQEQIHHHHIPLGPKQRLRCTRCDEQMEWSRHTATFDCDCRDFGVTSEAILHTEDISIFDVTVIGDD